MPYDKLAIQHTLLSKKPNIEPTYQPAPAKLFQAIMNGEPAHSWLEIDFNEFNDRKFKKGEIQRIFKSLLAADHQTLGAFESESYDS